MTLILGPLEDLLADESVKPEHLKKLTMIQRVANRLLQTVNQLLEFISQPITSFLLFRYHALNNRPRNSYSPTHTKEEGLAVPWAMKNDFSAVSFSIKNRTGEIHIDDVQAVTVYSYFFRLP